MGSVVDRLHRIWWNISDAVAARWREFRSASRRVKIIGVVGSLLVVAVVAGIVVAAAGGGEDGRQKQMEAAVVTNADLPANLWSGWTQRQLVSRPGVASTEDGTSAKPSECIPGGGLQGTVQSLAVDGSAWAGTQFTNIGLGARAETMLVASSRDVVAPVDKWVAACGSTEVKAKDGASTVTLTQLQVAPKVYSLAAARVFAQALTPAVANAEVSSTRLTAVGTTGQQIVYVTLNIPGEVSADALATLDTLWRAQAAKLVAYERSGNL